jgi:hypothetical protein
MEEASLLIGQKIIPTVAGPLHLLKKGSLLPRISKIPSTSPQLKINKIFNLPMAIVNSPQILWPLHK